MFTTKMIEILDGMYKAQLRRKQWMKESFRNNNFVPDPVFSPETFRSLMKQKLDKNAEEIIELKEAIKKLKGEQ